MKRRNDITRREPEPFEVEAYNIGWQLALRRRVKRTSATRREVRLDEHGNPVTLIEETVFTEEMDY